MTFKIQELSIDPKKLLGLSEGLVRSHHQNNYGGAVKRLSAIQGELAKLDWATAPVFQVNGLKREELIATNSVVLHELHFRCLGGEGQAMVPAMALALAASFGSVERWREEFVAMGKALGGGSGWVLLTFQPRDGTLVNQWAADHTQALAGGIPILALDMYEHAYQLDFGAKAGDYVDAFMANIAWDAVYTGYQHAVHGASQAFAAGQDDATAAVLIDVRRAGMFEQASNMIPGAIWRDPAKVGDWAADLPADREIIVYCVYGHEVSRATAMRLRGHGLNARYMTGGIDAWQKAGRPLIAKPLSVI